MYLESGNQILCYVAGVRASLEPDAEGTTGKERKALGLARPSWFIHSRAAGSHAASGQPRLDSHSLFPQRKSLLPSLCS